MSVHLTSSTLDVFPSQLRFPPSTLFDLISVCLILLRSSKVAAHVAESTPKRVRWTFAAPPLHLSSRKARSAASTPRSLTLDSNPAVILTSELGQLRPPHAPCQAPVAMKPFAAEQWHSEATIRRYQPVKLIGSGAYGVVCEALDRKTGRKVAIKKIQKVVNVPLLCL